MRSLINVIGRLLWSYFNHPFSKYYNVKSPVIVSFDLYYTFGSVQKNDHIKMLLLNMQDVYRYSQTRL